MPLRHLLACALAAFSAAAGAADWVAISLDANRRVEIDPASVKSEGSYRHVALGRLLFEKELTDTRSAQNYKSIEALTRFDCSTRTFTTLKRAWRRADGELLREEDVRVPAELPVRTGSLEDKLLREVCRPRSMAAGQQGLRAAPQSDAARQGAAARLAEQVDTAAAGLRRANEAMLASAGGKVAKTAAPLDPPPEKAPLGEPPASPALQPAPAPAPVAKPVAQQAPASASVAAPAAASSPPAPRPRQNPVVRKPAAKAASDAAAPTPTPDYANLPWAYEGAGAPENWGRLKPEYALCSSGKRQSPIDIRDGIRVDQPAIDFAWRPSQFRIVDNGHTVAAALGGSSIKLLGKTYELIEVSLHRPSEERVDGQGFEMSAHFLHKSEEGDIAIVVVLLERGAENPFVQTLLNYLPLEKNVSVTPPDVAIDPGKFLPAERGYYTYMGSLTTPPCTEGVQWLVLKQPVAVSAEQIAIFSRLYRNNARPIQPLFGRLIKESR